VAERNRSSISRIAERPVAGDIVEGDVDDGPGGCRTSNVDVRAEPRRAALRESGMIAALLTPAERAGLRDCCDAAAS
jgi:hypothetical protein